MTYIILAILILTALVAFNRYTLWRERRIIDRRINALLTPPPPAHFNCRCMTQHDIDNPEVRTWPR